MNPILFNTEMVRAILEDRKTMTRRVVKPQPVYENGFWKLGVARWSDGIRKITPVPCHTMYNCAPYRPGDILYVRETFCRQPSKEYPFVYKASVETPAAWKGQWHPSIHMPREAARIFLRVTDVKVQRVQDITEEEACKEGCRPGAIEITGDPWGVEDDPQVWTAIEHFGGVWNDCYAKPQPVKVEGVIHHYESYPWEDIQETRTYWGKPWYVIGNPWTWAIEFERCEKPEGGT